jgi:dienelactone hydrolase
VVLLIHDSAGVTDWFENFADQVAAMGYVAVVPNLMPDRTMPDLNAVADYAVKLPASDGRLFVSGIGWGGTQSFRFAADRADVAAALVICGASPDKDAVARVKGTIFGFYAANDARVNATVPPAQAAAKAADVVFEAVTYDGVGPQFMQAGDAPDAKPADKLARGYGTNEKRSRHGYVTRLLADQLSLHALNFVFHGLLAIDASSESHIGGNSRHAGGMQGFMALLHGGEDLVPLAFDIRTVGMELSLESRRSENPFTNCNLFGD